MTPSNDSWTDLVGGGAWQSCGVDDAGSAWSDCLIMIADVETGWYRFALEQREDTIFCHATNRSSPCTHGRSQTHPRGRTASERVGRTIPDLSRGVDGGESAKSQIAMFVASSTLVTVQSRPEIPDPFPILQVLRLRSDECLL